MKASVLFFLAGNRCMHAFSLSICHIGKGNDKTDISFPPLRHNHSLQICNPCMTVPLSWTHTRRCPSKTPFHLFHHNCHVIWNKKSPWHESLHIAPLSNFSWRRGSHLLVEIERCKFDDGDFLEEERLRKSLRDQAP